MINLNLKQILNRTYGKVVEIIPTDIYPAVTNAYKDGETHVVYVDTDSVIDGRDKTVCMYDVYERMVRGETKREILFPRQN